MLLIIFYLDLLLLPSECYEPVKVYSQEIHISAKSFKLSVIILLFYILSSLAESKIMLINIFSDIYFCTLLKEIIMSIGE